MKEGVASPACNLPGRGSSWKACPEGLQAGSACTLTAVWQASSIATWSPVLFGVLCRMSWADVLEQ